MKYLIIVITLIALVGCKDHEKQGDLQEIETKSVVVDVKQQDEEIFEVYTNTWVNNIQSGKDGRWIANKETNEGVRQMLNSLDMDKTTTLKDYKNLAKDLNTHKNYIIKNCTMQGDSHDNLHVWLLPLMAKIDALSEAESIEEASKLKKSIDENINMYSNYFE